MQTVIPAELMQKPKFDISFDDLDQGIGDDSLSALALTFSFKGFNAINFLKFLTHKADNKEQFKAHMLKLGILYVIRGTKINKILGKTSDAGRTEITELKARYSIIDSVPQTQWDVTLGRIAACMPGMIAKLQQRVGRVLGDRGVAPTLPKGLLFAGGAALIPLGDASDKFFVEWTNWSISFAKQTNNRAGQELEVALKYGTIIRGAEVLKDAKRKEICNALCKAEGLAPMFA
jgi:hypothetical protein